MNIDLMDSAQRFHLNSHVTHSVVARCQHYSAILARQSFPVLGSIVEGQKDST